MNDEYDKAQTAAGKVTTASDYKSAFAGKASSAAAAATTTTTPAVDTDTTFADVTAKVNALKTAVHTPRF